MKKYLTWLVIVMATLLPACCVFNGAKHAERSNLPEQVEQKTVALVHWMGPLMDEDGNPILDEDDDPVIGEVDPDKNTKATLTPYCAGVWISKDTVLTAEHCVDHLGKPPIWRMLEAMGMKPNKPWDPTGQPLFYSGFGDIKDTERGHVRTTHNATVLAVDSDHDLALVKATPNVMDSIPSHPIAELATSDVHVGDDVHIVGHTVGLWWSYTRGYVAQLRPGMPNADEKPVDSIQISAPVWFGNSGGGAFNADGELIGISSWLRKAPSIGFFVDYNVCNRFLRANGLRR